MSFNLYAQNIEIRGTVFEDKNGNNQLDNNEKGISGVFVSDQLNSTVSDADGNYLLKTNNDFPTVFISQPTGYTGKHYYSKSSIVNFPVSKGKSQTSFKFIHASDTHADVRNLPRINRFRELAEAEGVDFVLISGDLIRDALRVNEETARNYYEMYVNEISKFKVPVYSGVGNHEIFGIERDKSLVSPEHPLYGKKMFRHYLGPNYYSFNYGGIHFVSVDAVQYQNLYYYGGVDSLQLDWLTNDLNNVPADIPVITFNHIPFMSPGFSFQDFENDIFYGPQLLKQGDKLEHRHIVYNFEEVQKRIGDRPYPLALSGHYHAAMESKIIGPNTKFVQTSAITGPDQRKYQGFKRRSGFTVYEVKDGKIISSKFIPLNFK